MSRSDGAIVARHEVPGTAPSRKSRPVGYGMIRTGVCETAKKALGSQPIFDLPKFISFNFARAPLPLMFNHEHKNSST
jgi:hypothetical protein